MSNTMNAIRRMSKHRLSIPSMSKKNLIPNYIKLDQIEDIDMGCDLFTPAPMRTHRNQVVAEVKEQIKRNEEPISHK